MTSDVGSVAAWASAIITSVSLLVAALTYRRSRIDQRREQADNFHVWIDGAFSVSAKLVDDHDVDGYLTVHSEDPSIKVLNASGVPVYDAQASISWDALIVPALADQRDPILHVEGGFGLNAKYEGKVFRRTSYRGDYRLPDRSQINRIAWTRRLGIADAPNVVPPAAQPITVELHDERTFAIESMRFEIARGDLPEHPDAVVIGAVATIERVIFTDKAGVKWQRERAEKATRCR